MIKDVTPTTEISTSNTENLLPSDVTAYKEQLRKLPAVQNLTSEIDISNGNSIVMFGQKPAQEISQMSDRILSSMKMVKAEEASEMIIQLTKVMDKFDIEEIKSSDEIKKQGFLQKLVKKVKLSIDEIFEKYDDMGKEVDKIYTILKKYENDIKTSNNQMSQMLETNVKFYQELEQYIVAAEIAQEEIEAYKNQIQSNYNISEQEKMVQIQKLDLAKDMLSQRTYDLMLAENVAMQTVPMLQGMQMSNFNLQRKINSAFIITLPIFKQCLINALQLKRQEIQGKSLAQLDQKTNELLLRNANDASNMFVANAKLASGASLDINTLQSTYQTIMAGVDEAKQIQSQYAVEREQNKNKLESMKHEMKSNGTLATTQTPLIQ